MDKITVIVPVYNTKAYLPKCVESLQAQTYPELEILLVDDGSTDGSGELCDRLAEGDARIRVIHKPNAGSSSARNLGILSAAGDYLGFVDSDDYVDPDMYERLHRAIETYGVKIAQVGRDEITPEGEVLPDICIPPEAEECIPAKDFLKELLMHRGDCSFCTKLVARELFFRDSIENAGEGNSFPVGVLNEDFHLLVQMLEHSGAVASLPGHTYHVFYRVGSNSRKESKNEFSRVYTDNVVNADMVAEMVRNSYPELSDIAFRFGIFQRLDYLLHIPILQMTGSNQMYRDIVSYMRSNWGKAMKNPILTKKNKIYHTLFAIAPKGLRQVHALLQKAKGRG